MLCKGTSFVLEYKIKMHNFAILRDFIAIFAAKIKNISR